MLDKILSIFFTKQNKSQCAVFIRKNKSSFKQGEFKIIETSIFPSRALKEEFYRTMAMRAHL